MPSMGKQAKLKAARKSTKPYAQSLNDFSEQDLAAFYLNASEKEAAIFRAKLTDSFISEMTGGFTHTGDPIPMADVLCTLPLSFVLPYINLVGHSLIGSRHREFWPNIKNSLLAITTGTENETALREWGKSAGEISLLTNTVRKGNCYWGLQQLGERCDLVKKYSIWGEIRQNGLNCVYLDAIPTHLVISSCVAKEQIIHQSGSLVLCYAEDYTGNEGKELWLAKKRHDGIYATAAEAMDGTLKASEVRGMRHFVQNYQGLQIKGRLCPAREKEAARICKFVGLHIDGDYAYLKSPRELAL